MNKDPSRIDKGQGVPERTPAPGKHAPPPERTPRAKLIETKEVIMKEYQVYFPEKRAKNIFADGVNVTEDGFLFFVVGDKNEIVAAFAPSYWDGFKKIGEGEPEAIEEIVTETIVDEIIDEEPVVDEPVVTDRLMTDEEIAELSNEED